MAAHIKQYLLSGGRRDNVDLEKMVCFAVLFGIIRWQDIFFEAR